MFRILLLAVCLFTAINIPWITTLAAEYDEALYWPATVRMIHGSPQRLAIPNGLYLLNRPLPLMSAPYIGALNSYVYAVPVALFGSKVIVYRLTNAFILCGFLLLAARMAIQLGGKTAAWMTVALLCSNRELWLEGITNQGPFLLQLVSTCLLVPALLSYVEKPQKRLVVLMAMAVALGLNEKLTYLWVVASIAAVAALYFGRALLRARLALDLALAISVLAICTLPILIFTIGNFQMSSGFARSQFSWPADPITIISSRLHSAALLFDGQWTMSHRVGDFDAGLQFPIPLTSYIFALGLLLAIWRRNVLALFLYSVCLGVLAINCLLPEGGRLHHLILIYPLPQLAACLTIEREARHYASLRWLAYGVLAMGLTVAMLNLWGFGQVAQARGGSGTWSNQITALSDWERAHPETHLIYACWGVDHSIFALGEGKRQHLEFYFPLVAETLTPDTEAQLDRLLRRRDTVWVDSSIDDIQKRAGKNLLQAAAQRHLSPRTIREFREQDTGKVIFSVISFEPLLSVPAPTELRLRQLTPTSLEGPLTDGADRVNLRLRFQNVAAMDGIYIELQSQDGTVVQRHFRPLEYNALLDRTPTWTFGENLYPDWFLTDYPNPGKKASKIVVRLESANAEAGVSQQ